MDSVKKYLNNIDANEVQFKTKEFLSDGWDLGTKSFGYYFLYAIVAGVAGNVASLIPFAGDLANQLILAPVFGAGMILFFSHKFKTGVSNFGLVFQPFNKVGPLVVFQLIVFLVSLLLMIPAVLILSSYLDFSIISRIINGDPQVYSFIVNMISDNPTGVVLAGLTSGILFFIFSVLMCFGYHFITLCDMNGLDALKSSVKLVKSYFFPLVGFFILLGLINLLGLLALVIGVIVTISVSSAAMFIVFQRLVLDVVNEEETLDLGSDVLDA